MAHGPVEAGLTTATQDILDRLKRLQEVDLQIDDFAFGRSLGHVSPCKVKDTWPILTWFKENAFDEIAPLRTYLKLGLYIQLTQLHWRVAIRPSSRGDQPKGFVSAKAHIGPGRIV